MSIDQILQTMYVVAMLCMPPNLKDTSKYPDDKQIDCQVAYMDCLMENPKVELLERFKLCINKRKQGVLK